MPQGAWAGNEREVHRSAWHPDDFACFKVVESSVVKDDLCSGLLARTPGLPPELRQGISVLVAWASGSYFRV
jgi:hypothetical protein